MAIERRKHARWIVSVALVLSMSGYQQVNAQSELLASSASRGVMAGIGSEVFSMPNTTDAAGGNTAEGLASAAMQAGVDHMRPPSFSASRICR